MSDHPSLSSWAFARLLLVSFLLTIATSESIAGKPLPGYQIVRTTDISIRALDRLLSSYSLAELARLPLNVRKEYRIVVPTDVSRDQLMDSMRSLVHDETAKDPEIDEIVVFAYDRKPDTDAGFTFGKMEWCPSGRWAGVTSSIARTNDRSTYQFVFDIRAKVENSGTTDRPTAKEFEFHDAIEKALWADPNAAEEKVMRQVAKRLGVSVKRLDEAYLKVAVYNLK